MTLFRSRYRIETTRLQHHSYTHGWYFVTICTRKKLQWFGAIENGKMKLSSIGHIVQEEWLKTTTIRSNISLDDWCIMPDHMHGILILHRHPLEPVETPRGGVSGSFIPTSTFDCGVSGSFMPTSTSDRNLGSSIPTQTSDWGVFGSAPPVSNETPNLIETPRGGVSGSFMPTSTSDRNLGSSMPTQASDWGQESSMPKEPQMFNEMPPVSIEMLPILIKTSHGGSGSFIPTSTFDCGVSGSFMPTSTFDCGVSGSFMPTSTSDRNLGSSMPTQASDWGQESSMPKEPQIMNETLPIPIEPPILIETPPRGVSTQRATAMPSEYSISSVPTQTSDRGVSTQDGEQPGAKSLPKHWVPGSLGTIINQFKMSCTKRIRNGGFPEFSWQPRYHDRIIRSSAELAAIRKYIRTNPERWTKETIPWDEDGYAWGL